MTREEIEEAVRGDLARMDLDWLHRDVGMDYHTKVHLITSYVLGLLERYCAITPRNQD